MAQSSSDLHCDSSPRLAISLNDDNELLSAELDDKTTVASRFWRALTPKFKMNQNTTTIKDSLSKFKFGWKKQKVISTVPDQQWPPSLPDIYGDACLLEAFQEYMATQYALENMEFLESVEEFKKLETEDEGEIDEHIRSIYCTYIEKDSDKEVNVASRNRWDAIRKFDNLSNLSVAQKRNIFSLCEEDIRTLVCGNIIPFIHDKKFQAVVKESQSYKNYLNNPRSREAVDERPTDLSLNNDDSKDDSKDDEVTDNVNNALDSPSPSPHDQRLDVSFTPYDSMTPDSLPTRDVVDADMAEADTSSEEEKKEESPDDQALDHLTGGFTERPCRVRSHALTDGNPQHFHVAKSGDNASGSHAYAERIEE